MSYGKYFVFILLRLALHAAFVVVVLYPASYVALVYGIVAVGSISGSSSASIPVVISGYAVLLLCEAVAVTYRAQTARWVRFGIECVALSAGAVGGTFVLLAALTHYAYGFPMFYLGAVFWLSLFLGVEFALAALVRGVLSLAAAKFGFAPLRAGTSPSKLL